MATHRDSVESALPKARKRLPMYGHDYLVAHACFECKKSWKVSLDATGRICPQCGGQLCEMGRSFKAPKAKDSEQWEKVRRLRAAGFGFYSYRSYPDAEPFPDRLSQVDDFISRNPRHPSRVDQS